MLELIKLDPTIELDIRYARDDNFVGRAVYSEPRAFLQKHAAEALVRAHRRLLPSGIGLVIYDGYRPWSVTRLFWEVVTNDQKKFVADPAVGSKHNRGCAVDLGLFDRLARRQMEMPSDFDEFNEKASPEYTGGTLSAAENRDLLRKVMEAEGYAVNPREWWHFDYKDWEKYPILDVSFAELDLARTG